MNESDPDGSSGGPSGLFKHASSLDLLSSDSTSLSTRFVFSLLGYSASLQSGAVSAGFHAQYQISFDVLANAGEPWQVDITTQRHGAITLVDRSPTGSAGAALPVLTFTPSGSGVFSGSLSFPSVLEGVNEPPITSGSYVPFDQSTSGQIVGTGTGSAQTIAIDASKIFPFILWEAQDGGTDEAAIRAGIALPATDTSAADYPGVGDRDIKADGNFVNISLIQTPEPGVGGLLSVIAFAAVLRRRRRAF